jgi:hypothetical protein
MPPDAQGRSQRAGPQHAPNRGDFRALTAAYRSKPHPRLLHCAPAARRRRHRACAHAKVLRQAAAVGAGTVTEADGQTAKGKGEKHLVARKPRRQHQPPAPLRARQAMPSAAVFPWNEFVAITAAHLSTRTLEVKHLLGKCPERPEGSRRDMNGIPPPSQCAAFERGTRTSPL